MTNNIHLPLVYVESMTVIQLSVLIFLVSGCSPLAAPLFWASGNLEKSTVPDKTKDPDGTPSLRDLNFKD